MRLSCRPLKERLQISEALRKEGTCTASPVVFLFLKDACRILFFIGNITIILERYFYLCQYILDIFDENIAIKMAYMIKWHKKEKPYKNRT